VANQGVLDSQAGPERIGTDCARDADGAAAGGGTILNLATEERLRQ